MELSKRKLVRNLVKYPSLIFLYGGQARRITSESIQELLTDTQREVAELKNEYRDLEIDSAKPLAEVKALTEDRKQVISDLKNETSQLATLEQEISDVEEIIANTASTDHAALSNLNSMKDNLADEIKAATIRRDALLTKQKEMSEKLNDASSTLEELVNRQNEIKERSREIEEGFRGVAVSGKLDKDNVLYSIEELVTNAKIPMAHYNFTESTEFGDFRAVLQEKFEDVYDNSLNEILGKVAEGRTAINDAVGLTHAVFTVKLREKIQKFMETRGYVPSVATVKRMATVELREFFPHFKGPLNLDDDSAIDLSVMGQRRARPKWIDKQVKSAETNADKAQAKLLTSALSRSRTVTKTLNSEGTVVKDESLPVFIEFDFPGVKPVIRQIINIDATIQHKQLRKHPNQLTLFDASLGSPVVMPLIAEGYSQDYLTTSKEVNLSRNAYDFLSNIFNQVKNEETGLEEVTLTEHTDVNKLLAGNYNPYFVVWNSSPHNSLKVGETFAGKFQETLNTLKEHADAKDRFYDTYFDQLRSTQMSINPMYGNREDGSLIQVKDDAYVPDIQEITVDSLVKENIQAEGSFDLFGSYNVDMDVDYSLNSLERDNITPNTWFFDGGKSVGDITLANFTSIFDAFRTISSAHYGSVTEQTIHENQLSKVMTIMRPVLKELGQIKMAITDIDGYTQGDAAKHDDFIRVNLDRSAAPATLLAQTPAEVYVHENGHILLTRALQGDKRLARNAQLMLDNLTSYMHENGGYKVFLQGIANPSEADISHAKKLYNYLLDNTDKNVDELAEFIMLGLTNRHYIRALQSFKNTPKHHDADQWFDHLMDLISKAIDYVIRTIKGTKDQDAYADLLNLAQELVLIQNSQISKYAEISEGVSDAFTNANNAVKAYANSVHRRINQLEIEGKLGIPLGIYNIASFSLSRLPSVREVREKIISSITSKTLRDTLYEMSTGTLSNKMTLLLLRSKFIISKLRRMIEVGYEEHFAKLFPDVTTSEEQLLTTTVLESDLSAVRLAGISTQDIFDMLGDTAKQEQLKQKLLKDIDPRMLKRIKPYLDELAHYIVTGEGDVTGQIRDGYDNVYQIVLDKFRGKLPTSAVLESVDAYVSVQALQSIPKLNESSLLRKLSPKILDDLLLEHMHYKTDVAKNLFDNPYEMKKGYIKKRQDPFVNYRVGTASDATHFKKLGYPVRIDLGMIPGLNDSNAGFQKTYLYVGKYVPTTKLISGIASFTEQTPSFKLDIHRLNTSGDKVDPRLVKRIQKQLTKQNIKYPVNVRPIRKAFRTKTGKVGYGIVGYRAILPNEVENKHFNSDLKFSDVLAHMKSNYYDQINSQTVNSALVNLYLEETSNITKKNKRMFINLLSPEYIDYYNRLPSYTQKEIWNNRDESGEFLVRENILDKTLGFEQETVSHLYINERNFPELHKWVNRSTHLLASVMKSAVEKIALGTTQVIKSNLVSNIYQLTIRGIGPVYLAKKVKEGYLAYQDYVVDYKKLLVLRDYIEKYNLDDNAKQSREAVILSKKLENNPMHNFFQLGLQSMIVEEVNDASHTGYYEHLVDKALGTKAGRKIPNSVIEVAQILALTPNSKLFLGLKHIVAMTDLLARYVMVEHAGDMARKNGTSIKAAKDAELIEALRAFVVFDENLSPKLQMLSDMGLWWFARYFFRNQRVSVDLVSDYPVNTAIAAGIQFSTDFDAMGNIASSILMGNMSPMLMNQLRGLEIVTDPNYGYDQAVALYDTLTP